MALLQVDNLAIGFKRSGRITQPVAGVSLRIAAGERVALVGESGCGKSLTALALARLAPTDRALLSGGVTFDGRQILELSRRELLHVRGRGIAYVFQDPAASLNPVMRVGKQIGESLPELRRDARAREALVLLRRVGLPEPERALRAYPCELSGGQQQRVMLAMALAARPRLLVADEPTTALDVTTQQQVLDLIEALTREYNMALLLITHNLGLLPGRLERVYVMYGGAVVESGTVAQVLGAPRHPYTQGLLAAVPRLDLPRNATLRDIPGSVPERNLWTQSCAFAPRCDQMFDRCRQEPPPFCYGSRGEVRCWLAGGN